MKIKALVSFPRTRKRVAPPIFVELLKRIAPKIGATVAIEPRWNIVGQITFKNGKKKYFRYASLDLNPLGASEIAKDKDYANYFMKRMGYPTVPGRAFFSDAWARTIGSKRTIHAAWRYANVIGLPVIVKPNSGSQGSGVALVSTKRAFYEAMRRIFKRDRVALVQKAVTGKDYRVVVLNDKVISAYQRIPLSVMGDGISPIQHLLKKKQADFIAVGRDTRINASDPRISEKLRRQGYTLRSVVPKNERVYLLDNANLSTGGDSNDVTNEIHPEFQNIAVNLTKDMGLRLCGVDLMIEGTIAEAPQNYRILEINAAPGLDHYAKSGPEQEKIVANLFLEVLKSLEKN